jgi:hypothetical protein
MPATGHILLLIIPRHLLSYFVRNIFNIIILLPPKLEATPSHSSTRIFYMPTILISPVEDETHLKVNISLFCIGLQVLTAVVIKSPNFWYTQPCSAFKADHSGRESKAWTVFARPHNGIVGSNPTWFMGVCVPLFCDCAVLCVGSDLARGWSPVEGILPTLKRSRNWKSGQDPTKGCTAIVRVIDSPFEVNRHFGGMCCLLIQERKISQRRNHVPLKC